MNMILKARPRRTVLVVEDALTTRCILEQFFARAGCDVLHAGDPDTALMRLRTSTIDAVILDLRLADERSGLEVLEQMRLDERYDDVPVVVLTGVTEVDAAEDETSSSATARTFSTSASAIEKSCSVSRRFITAEAA